MVSTNQPDKPSPIRKLRPKAKPPAPGVEQSLSAREKQIVRARLSDTVEYVHDPFLDRGDAEAILMGPLPARPGECQRSVAGNDDSGVDLFALGYALTVEQERHLFLRLNYCRQRVFAIVAENAGQRLSAEVVRDLIKWEQATLNTRSDIVRANVPLVLAMAKRTRITGVDYADLISEGNLALLRSVDKFDCGRGFKFSTYACRAILKSFARVAARTSRHRVRFPTEFDPTLEKSDHVEQKRTTIEDECVSELKSILSDNRANLNEVEERVIRARFALDEPADAAQARTLEQVGTMIGVTKERVRQIQNKALVKLRAVLQGGILAR